MFSARSYPSRSRQHYEVRTRCANRLLTKLITVIRVFSSTSACTLTFRRIMSHESAGHADAAQGSWLREATGARRLLLIFAASLLTFFSVCCR